MNGAAAAALLSIGLLTACTAAEPSVEPSPAPTASEVRSTDPEIDIGQRISITAQGAVPRQLLAIVEQPVTWVNQTDAEQTVTFENLSVDDAVLAPGEEFVFTPPGAISVAYRVSTAPDELAAIQVEPEEPAGEG